MSKLLKDDSKLINQWNYKKNNNSILETVTTGSGKKVWWVCDKGHEWEASILNRSQGRNCPYCSNKIILPGINDLATYFPDIASEWNYERNKDAFPWNVAPHSQRKVWWKCSTCNYEWPASIANRTSTNGSGCERCIVGEVDGDVRFSHSFSRFLAVGRDPLFFVSEVRFVVFVFLISDGLSIAKALS